jgi:DnaJ domain
MRQPEAVGRMPVSLRMSGGDITEAFSLASSNASVLALLVVLSSLFAGCIHYNMSARRMRPDFALRKLESIELTRAMLLYEKASGRLKEIYHDGEQAGAAWLARARRSKLRQKFGEELEDLEAYADDLRSVIVRLKLRPIQRYKSWAHVLSSQFAFSCALACYYLILALLTGYLYAFDDSIWAQGRQISFGTFMFWEQLGDRLLYSNWIAASLVFVLVPALYFGRRVTLQREHGQQLRELKELARTDPDRLVDRSQINVEEPEESLKALDEMSGKIAWYDILEVSPSATLDEIKEVYKAKVKQSHPDRVHDMSPAFKRLAEAETKKLNVAYTEALAALRSDY